MEIFADLLHYYPNSVLLCASNDQTPKKSDNLDRLEKLLQETIAKSQLTIAEFDNIRYYSFLCHSTSIDSNVVLLYLRLAYLIEKSVGICNTAWNPILNMILV